MKFRDLIFIVSAVILLISPSWSMDLEATVAISGRTSDVQISGNYAYAADNYGLWIVDMTDPQEIESLGHWGSPGLSEGLSVNGNTAYLCDGEEGLFVIDVGNPNQPQSLGLFGGSSHAYAAAVNGNWLYMAAGEDGLAILDVSDPENPALAGNYPTTGWAKGIAWEGTTVALAVESQGVLLLDVSDPVDPSLLTQIDLQGNAQQVILDSDYLYVLVREDGFGIWDVSTPSQPDSTVYVETGGWATDMILDGSTLIISDWFEGVSLIDLSIINRPEVITSFQPLGLPEAMSLQGDLLMLAIGDEGLEVWDISTVTTPEQVSSEDPVGSSLDVVTTQDALVYEAAGDAGLRVWDYDLDPPEPLSQIDTPGWANAIGFSEYYLYLSDGFQGLRIYTRGSSPSEAFYVPTTNYAGKVGVTWIDTYQIFVSQGSAGFLSITHDELQAPVVNGTTQTEGFVFDLCCNANIMVTCEGLDGFAVYDVSDPAAPNLLTTQQPAGGAWSCALGSDLYIGTGNDVEVYDMSIPVSPALTSTLENVGWAESIDFIGNGQLAICSGEHGVYGVDLWQSPPVIFDYENSPGVARAAAGFVGALILADDMALSRYGIATGIGGSAASVPAAFTLEGPFPNPFNPSTSISFALTTATKVELSVYDMLGRRVASLWSGNLKSGEHRFSWQPNASVASGMYVVSMEAGDRNVIRPLVYLK